MKTGIFQLKWPTSFGFEKSILRKMSKMANFRWPVLSSDGLRLAIKIRTSIVRGVIFGHSRKSPGGHEG